MTVIYVDSVFLLNTAMDYVLFLVTARLAGIPLRRGRYVCGAVAGGLYAAAVFFPGLGFLGAGPVKLAVGVLLALMAFGGEKKLLRLTLLLFAVSCAMAGCVLALGLLAESSIPMVNGIFYTDVDGKVLLVAAAAAYLVLTVVFRAAAKHGLRGELVPVRICIDGRTTEMTALADNGNDLRDPSDGRPVLVVAPGTVDDLFPQAIRTLLTPERLAFPADLLASLRSGAPALRPRLLPYQAVGTSGGLLLTIRTAWVEIGGTHHAGLPVALSPTGLGTGYAALWGGEVRKEGRYGVLEDRVETAGGPSGTAAG